MVYSCIRSDWMLSSNESTYSCFAPRPQTITAYRKPFHKQSHKICYYHFLLIYHAISMWLELPQLCFSCDGQLGVINFNSEKGLPSRPASSGHPHRFGQVLSDCFLRCGRRLLLLLRKASVSVWCALSIRSRYNGFFFQQMADVVIISIFFFFTWNCQSHTPLLLREQLPTSRL